MTARLYAKFDGGNIGTGLEIQQAGEVVTTDADALDIGRTVFLTLPQTEDDSDAEFLLYGYGDPANKVSIGVATTSKALNTYVGADTDSIGYRVAEGQIHHGGASIASVSAGGLDSVIRVAVRFLPTSVQVAFYLDGVLQHTETYALESPSGPLFGESLVLAVSLGNESEAGDLRVFCNTGKRDPEHALAGFSGWWHAVTLPETFYVATAEWISGPTDDFPHQRYAGVIADESAVLTRRLRFWTDGNTQSLDTAALTLTINDPTGAYDHLVGGVMRDLPVSFLHVDDTDTDLSAAQSVGSFVVESFEAIDDGRKRLVLRDDQVLLTRPLQTRFFLPNATAGAANRAWPTSIGAAFSVPCILYDEADAIYAIDSKGAGGVGKVRDRGFALDPVGSPTDYALLSGGQSVQLFFDAAGLVTADISVTGGTFEETVDPDAINDIGNPFTGTIGAAPTGWTQGRDNPLSDFPAYDGNGRVRFTADATWLTPTTEVLTTNTQYKWQFTLYGQTPPAGQQSRIVFSQLPSIFGSFASYTINETTTFPVTLSGTFTTGSLTELYLLADFFGQGGPEIVLGEFAIVEVPPLDDGTEDAVDESVEPLQLAPMLQEILERRAGFASDYWSYADAASIDSDSGYRGSGYHAREQVAIYTPIVALLDGYTAAPFKDRNGTLRVFRMIFAEDVGPSNWAGHLYEHQMLSPLVPTIDGAPGLTTRIGARRNWQPLGADNTGPFIYDTAVSSDTVTIPMAVRRKLARDFRYVLSSGVQVSAQYRHAEAAEPLETCLNDAVSAQTEIDRVLTGYSVPRAFWSTSIPLDTDIELGQVWAVHYPRYFIDEEDGTPMLVTEIAEDLIAETVRRIVFRAVAPAILFAALSLWPLIEGALTTESDLDLMTESGLVLVVEGTV